MRRNKKKKKNVYQGSTKGSEQNGCRKDLVVFLNKLLKKAQKIQKVKIHRKNEATRKKKIANILLLHKNGDESNLLNYPAKQLSRQTVEQK